MRLVLSKALFFVAVMSPCMGSSIEGDCSITSIDFCSANFFNSSRGTAQLGLRCDIDFTTSTEDHIKTPRCSTIEKGNNYEIRGDLVERVDQSRVVSQPPEPMVPYALVQDPVYFCDVSNCKKSSNCNASDFNKESRESTCLCYDSATIEHLHQFKFLELIWLVFFGIGLLLIVLPIIMFFNINLVSGASRSFVFFYQCLPLASPAGKLLSPIVMQNQIYTFPFEE